MDFNGVILVLNIKLVVTITLEREWINWRIVLRRLNINLLIEESSSAPGTRAICLRWPCHPVICSVNSTWHCEWFRNNLNRNVWKLMWLTFVLSHRTWQARRKPPQTEVVMYTLSAFGWYRLGFAIQHCLLCVIGAYDRKGDGYRGLWIGDPVRRCTCLQWSSGTYPNSTGTRTSKVSKDQLASRCTRDWWLCVRRFWGTRLSTPSEDWWVIISVDGICLGSSLMLTQSGCFSAVCTWPLKPWYRDDHVSVNKYLSCFQSLHTLAWSKTTSQMTSHGEFGQPSWPKHKTVKTPRKSWTVLQVIVFARGRQVGLKSNNTPPNPCAFTWLHSCIQLRKAQFGKGCDPWNRRFFCSPFLSISL